MVLQIERLNKLDIDLCIFHHNVWEYGKKCIRIRCNLRGKTRMSTKQYKIVHVKRLIDTLDMYEESVVRERGFSPYTADIN